MNTLFSVMIIYYIHLSVLEAPFLCIHRTEYFHKCKITNIYTYMNMYNVNLSNCHFYKVFLYILSMMHSNVTV